MKNKSMLLAWGICGLAALFYAYEYLLRISPSAMEGPLRAHFTLSATGFGWLSAVYYYAYVPMQLPVGMLMDRFGPRRLLSFACLVCALGTWMFSASTVLSFSALGRFFIGLGSAFAFVGVLKLSTIWLPEDRLALVAGMTSALGTLGAMVGDNLLSKMVGIWGWQESLFYAAMLGGILFVFLWGGIRDHNKDREMGGTIHSFRVNFIDLKIILCNKQVWLNGLFGCLVYLPTTVFAELWGIPYLAHAHGLSETSAAFANSLLFFGFTLGAPTMGFISDKLKRRKLPMIIGAMGAAILMSAILYYPNLNEHSIGILMFLLGLFYSAQTIVFAVGRELSPKEAGGTAIAMTNMIVMMGALFLQPLVGRLLDISVWARHAAPLILLKGEHLQYLYIAADYRWAMSTIPVGILVAAFLTIFIRETYAEAQV